MTIVSSFRPESPLYRPPGHFLRGSLGRFVTGVAVVSFEATGEDGGREPHGITVNSFTSVSMEPPLVLVSIQRTVRSHDMLFDCAFTVNILGAEQQAVAMHFAGRPNNEPLWVQGEHAPRLASALSWFECTPWAQYDGGDHTLFLGEVRDFGFRSGDALGFVNGQFTVVHEAQLGFEELL